jgi:hypothetical protein
MQKYWFYLRTANRDDIIEYILLIEKLRAMSIKITL